MDRQQRLAQYNSNQRVDLVRKAHEEQGYAIISSLVPRRVGEVLNGHLGSIERLAMAVIGEATYDDWIAQRRRYYSGDGEAQSKGVYYYKVKAE
jgi:predicted HD phosphohydrolase